ncbi:MAG: biopolymer transporter ExbD [Saprospiraceae bacterium]|nr:biopolymer transporter ExbD [Saprospiraceae bacterium]
MGLKKRNKANAEFNMSSLTDIIFLLLIFFMLTSNMKPPNTKKIERPKSNTTTPSPQNVHVTIDKDPSDPNKKIYFVAKDENPTPLPQLKDRMKLEVDIERENIKKNDAPHTEVTVVLNVLAEEKTGTIVEMMKLSNDLGVRLLLATDPE